jgi:hypothetical protein
VAVLVIDRWILVRLTRGAVFAIVRCQVEVGADLNYDGEMLKSGYSIYVATHLTRFASYEPAKPRLDTGCIRISSPSSLA